MLRSHNTQNIRMESSMRVKVRVSTKANFRITKANTSQQLGFCCSFLGLAHGTTIGLEVYTLPMQSYRCVRAFSLHCVRKVLNVKVLSQDRIYHLNLGEQLWKFPVFKSYFSNPYH